MTAASKLFSLFFVALLSSVFLSAFNTLSSHVSPTRFSAKREEFLLSEFTNTTTQTNSTAKTASGNNGTSNVCVHECSLQNASLGVPVVLLSQGRSGSASIWEIVSTLLSKTTERVSEDPGSTSTELSTFMKSQEANPCWLPNLLCKKQRHNAKRLQSEGTKTAIYGTKWKPYEAGINQTAARLAFKWIAQQNSLVKVIYNERNPLDVLISRSKHHASRGSKISIPAHCVAGDKKCLRMHAEMRKKASVDIATLFPTIKGLAGFGHNARALLQELKVPFLEVSYEKLYYSDNADEWKKILNFLELEPRVPVTVEAVRQMSKIVPTSGRDRSQKISNYDKVVKALTGTEFEMYL